MGRPSTGVSGLAELFPLAAILDLPANSAVNLKSLFWDHATDLLMQGPEGSRTIVDVTGVEPVFLNMYGTSYDTGQDEATADAPVQFGDADQAYGDNSEVTSIIHNASFAGVYDSQDPYWIALKTAAGLFGVDRLLYMRFFPKGKAGTEEVYHGVVEPRSPSNSFPRDDYYTFTVDFVYKTRRYDTVLPAQYPLPETP